MNSEPNLILQQITIWILPIIFAITVHEAAHGWVALKLGDTTAQRRGRVTLNPLKHIDILGTLIIPIMMLVLSGFLLGWAKPVPVNWQNLRHPRRDIALVAIAGPSANLFMAILWAIIAKLGWLLHESFEPAVFFTYMGRAGIFINVVLMIINLLPILPLDGGRIAHSLMPPRLAQQFGRLEPFGLLILIFLLIIGLLEKILFPLVLLSYELLVWLVNMQQPLSLDFT